MAAICALAPPNPLQSSRSDFYVSAKGSDRNNGSAKRPWKTINHAASVVKPDATVHVAAGEYQGNVTTSVSGTSTARIRFISEQQGAAHIVGGTGEAAWLNKGDYVDIMGFDVTGKNPNGIENLGSNVRILANIVHDITAFCDSNGGSGINNANYSAHDNDIGGNFVHDILNSPGCRHPNAVGIYHSNLRGRVYNNLSVHNGTEGIQFWHAANAVIVANNTVISNGENGIVVGAGDSPGGITNDNSLVINNIAVNNAFYGIQEFGKTGSSNRYLNNLVFGNPSGNLVLLTGKASGTITADAKFVNNTKNATGDYHLGPKSPAIDAGISTNAPTTDIAGGTRPQGKAVDIGAYEAGAAAEKWPWR
jgi:uncharacterized protein DUF1565